jgi:hypothetical protein
VKGILEDVLDQLGARRNDAGGAIRSALPESRVAKEFAGKDESSEQAPPSEHRLLIPMFKSLSFRFVEHKSNPVEQVHPSTSHRHATDSMIGELEVNQQQGNDSCGYFALFNALTCLTSICASDDALATRFLSKIRNRAYFWSWFYATKLDLLVEAKKLERSHYPWVEKVINSGVMERPYLQHLLRTDQWVASLESLEGAVGLFTTLSEFGINTLKFNG